MILPIKQKTWSQIACNFQKNDFNEIINTFPAIHHPDARSSVLKNARNVFAINSEKIRSENKNFHQTVFISKISAKSSPGLVESSIDNCLEEFLQSPKKFRSTSENDEIYYFYFNRIAFMKLFLCKRGIHFWKKCWEEPCHVSKRFR